MNPVFQKEKQGFLLCGSLIREPSIEEKMDGDHENVCWGIGY
jgi:hypothetical protein